MDALFDLAGSLQRMGGDEQLFRTMVRFLQTDGVRRMAELRQGLERGDLAGVERAAHALKGQISNFGAGRAWNAAALVEHAAQQMNHDEAATGVSQLAAALKELLAALAPWSPVEVAT